MGIHSTEEEQLQDLKNWFKKNGTFLITVLVAFSCCVGAWKFWQARNRAYAENASLLYEKFQMASSDTDLKVIATDLSHKYPSSIYGKIASVYLVNKKAADKKWDEMAIEYKKLYDKTSEWPDLQIVILENWIRALLESNQDEAAFNNLQSASKSLKWDSLYPLNFYNLKGDVLAKQSKNQEAIESYNKAIDSVNANPQVQQQMAQFLNWIVLKRNDLLSAKPLA